MPTDRKTLQTRRTKFPNSLGRLQNLGLRFLFLTALPLLHCAQEEPHYLPGFPLPDMRGSAATQGVPCAVSKLVADRCIACHGQTPTISGLALVSYADLTAASAVEPKKKVVERMLTRMESPTNPMPPGAAPTVPPTELDPLQTWVTAGTPMTTCTQ